MKYKRVLKLGLFIFAVWLLFGSRIDAVFSGGQGDQELVQQALAIIESQCLQCHGSDRMSGLDLRTRAALMSGGSRGEAVVPGDSAGSLLFRYLTGKESPRMPLGGEMTADQIEVIRKWIDSGAEWPADAALVAKPAESLPPGKAITDVMRDYWAFRKLVRPEVPKVSRSFSNPIDAFILSELESRGLTPSAPADKRTLLRRVTIDLTGLPPTIEETRSFLADDSPDAYRKVVDRLLNSPRYGERWGQHWLDVVRFAETNGFELDQDREQAWRYRDYVIRSINEDKPYDRFILEQLAGDEIAPDDFEMRVATGFLRAGPQHVVAGNQDLAVNRQEYLTEIMFGVSNGIMGLTIGCARCHDHKFDPILQADYYRMQAFFASSDNLDFKQPTKEQEAAHKAAMDAHKQKLKPITDQIDAIEKPYKEKLKAGKRARLEPEYARALEKEEKLRTDDEKRLAKDAQSMLNVGWDEVLAALNPEDKERRAALRRQMHAINLYQPEPLPKALAVSDIISPVPAMHLLKGGDPHRPGAEVPPRFLTVLMPKDAPPAAGITPVTISQANGETFKSTGRRLALGKWLTRPDHPLTARVMVNRLWHHHFGKGIVATPNDFGRNGQPPTHPELLDWLAVEFVENDWSLKHMHRLMVLSNVYRQSSGDDPAKSRIDPDNKALWRMNRQRLDAEAIRDSVLAVSGRLTEQIGGPPIRVPLEPEVYDTIFTEYEADNLWPVHPDPRQHTRRSLYLLRKRNVKLPMLVAFDAPDLMSSCGARSVSVHALQALTMINSPFMFDQSKALAARLFREIPVNNRLRIIRMYELALGRRPNAQELRLTQDFLTSQAAVIRQRIGKGEPIAKVDNLPATIDKSTTAAWVELCLATMNLNEFIYVR
ncbi:MAG: PSD1 domain-containing protein [Acidobacteria bacterium]|nr:PSD1 domain-containing protein [Acidobacteriota bacterium]